MVIDFILLQRDANNYGSCWSIMLNLVNMMLIITDAKLIWEFISTCLNLNLGHNFESVARFWLANKKHSVTNAVSSAVLWSLWKFRNEMCFQGRIWMGLKEVWFKIAKMLTGWVPMMKEEVGEAIKVVVLKLEKKVSLLPQLTWTCPESSSSRLEPLAVRHIGSRAASQTEDGGLNSVQNWVAGGTSSMSSMFSGCSHEAGL